MKMTKPTSTEDNKAAGRVLNAGVWPIIQRIKNATLEEKMALWQWLDDSLHGQAHDNFLQSRASLGPRIIGIVCLSCTALTCVAFICWASTGFREAQLFLTGSSITVSPVIAGMKFLHESSLRAQQNQAIIYQQSRNSTSSVQNKVSE
jgi:hypothetical protein